MSRRMSLSSLSPESPTATVRIYVEDIVAIDLILLIIIGFLPIIIIVAIFGLNVVRFVRSRARMRLLELFKSGTRGDGSRLLLPEEVVVEVGIISIKRFRRAAGRGRTYAADFRVLNSTSLSTKVIELDRVCDSPFYVYADFNDNILIEAPGLVVGSGRFKDIVVLCMDPSRTPERVIEVSAGEGVERAVSTVRVGGSGIELSLAWGLGAPRRRRVVYDDKQGVYRVVEEHVEKPRAREARLEVCLQTPGPKFCTTLAKLSTPGTSTSATLPFKVGETFVFLLKDMLSYTTLKKAIGLRTTSSTPIVVGYRPGYITVKLVLDIPLARDIVREVEL